MTQLDWRDVSREWQAQGPPPAAPEVHRVLRRERWRTRLGVTFDLVALVLVSALIIRLSLSAQSLLVWIAASVVLLVNGAIVAFSLWQRHDVWRSLTAAPGDRVVALRARARAALQAARFSITVVAAQAIAVVAYVGVRAYGEPSYTSTIVAAVVLASVLIAGHLAAARARIAWAHARLREATLIEEMLYDPEDATIAPM